MVERCGDHLSRVGAEGSGSPAEFTSGNIGHFRAVLAAEGWKPIGRECPLPGLDPGLYRSLVTQVGAHVFRGWKPEREPSDFLNLHCHRLKLNPPLGAFVAVAHCHVLVLTCRISKLAACDDQKSALFDLKVAYGRGKKF